MTDTSPESNASRETATEREARILAEVDEINNGPGNEGNIDPFEMSKAIHD